MSKIISGAFFSVILASLVIITPGFAQGGPTFTGTGPKNGDTWTPRLPGPAPAVANPLVVTDVVVDKEAANAVVAREQAMTESRRAAFMKLAERNMTPAEFKAYKPPKDSDIAMLVQDFEVQDEQMSSTRYVGTFTVRFRDGVRHYMTVHDDTGPVDADLNDQKPDMADADAESGDDPYDPTEDGTDTATGPTAAGTERAPNPNATMESRRSWQEATYGDRARPGLVQGSGEPLLDSEPIAQSVLILPYFENISGQTMLWEEQNPWLGMWQGALPKSPGGRRFFVPLGDISDIATGASNGVWSGDYTAIDALLRNYGAEQAVLAVANKSGPELTVEVYTYRAGKLRRRATLKPYTGDGTGADVFRKGIYETIGYLQAPAGAPPSRPSMVVQTSHDILSRPTLVIDSSTDSNRAFVPSHPLVMKPLGQNYQTYEPAVAQQVAAVPVMGGATRIDATMQFNDSRSWMDMQRRLSAIMPPVRVDISSMSSNSVSFTLSSDAPAGTVKQALYAHGVELHPPAYETGQTGAGVYDVRLAPLSR